MTRALPETKEEFESYEGDIQNFVDKWYSWQGFLSFSLHMFELESANEAVADIDAAFCSGSYDKFLSAKKRLETVFRGLAAGEKAGFVHIF